MLILNLGYLAGRTAAQCERQSLWFKGKEFTCSSLAAVQAGALAMDVVRGMFELLS